MNNAPLDLVSLVGREDRDLLVVALQALWRERVAARNAISVVAQLDPAEQKPIFLVEGNEAFFGIEVVAQMLRRVGAGPM